MNPVVLFEDLFKQWVGAKHCIAVNSGSSGGINALMSVGVRAGDYVITTPYTYVAGANAILHAGATPIFVDVKEDLTLDPEQVDLAIEKFQTKKNVVGAIMPVHIFGRPCDMEQFYGLYLEHGIPIVEDACQATGVKIPFDGFNPHTEKYLGTIGSAGFFSTYMTKNLWTFQGGLIVTDRDSVAMKARQLRKHGIENGMMVDLGWNQEMPWNCAFIGWQQLLLHKPAIKSEIGRYSPSDGYYPLTVYQHPWYQNNPKRWLKLDCPIAEEKAKEVNGILCLKERS